jgi:hypothetical protein
VIQKALPGIMNFVLLTLWQKRISMEETSGLRAEMWGAEFFLSGFMNWITMTDQ